LEENLSRVIKPESAAADRTRLSRLVVLALRELMKQTETSDTTRDLVAFISSILREIYLTVENSVVAWEKRDYWVKADRFRMEWEWAQAQSIILEKSLLADDWANIARSSATIGQKLSKIKVGEKIRGVDRSPWIGKWKQIKDKKSL
jgi:hypothetical protein